MQGGDESESKAQARQDSDTGRAVPEQGCPGRPFCCGDTCTEPCPNCRRSLTGATCSVVSGLPINVPTDSIPSLTPQHDLSCAHGFKSLHKPQLIYIDSHPQIDSVGSLNNNLFHGSTYGEKNCKVLYRL